MRPPPSLLALASVVGVAVPLGTGNAAAASPGREVAVNLSYQSPKGCPSRNAVVEQLENCGLRVIAETAEKHLSIDVAPYPTGGHRFRGQLTVDAPNGPSLSRAVDGQDCRAVTQSLALVAGLALNPTTIDATPRRAASDDHPATDVVIVVQTRARDAEDRSGWYVGVMGRGMTALGLGPAVGFGAFVERTRGELLGFPFSLALSVATVAPATVTLPLGSADLRAYFTRIDGCAYGAIVVGSVVLSPCVGMEGGLLQARGTIARPQTAARPWFAPQISARGAVPLTRRVSLSFAGYAFAPLVRDTFVFREPDATIYRTPVLGGTVEIGLAGAF